MKMLLRSSLVLVLCLAFASVSFAGKYDAYFVEGGAQHCITYDNYCDGICYSIYSGGSVDGSQTGCKTGALFGTVGGRAVHISYDCSADYDCGLLGFAVHTIIRSDGTWTHYGVSGGAVTILNSGTWTPGSPRVTEGLPTSIGR